MNGLRHMCELAIAGPADARQYGFGAAAMIRRRAEIMFNSAPLACATLLVLVASMLSACASAPQYLYNVDPAADVAKYRTYGFFDERRPEQAAYQSVAHRHLKAAISREMQARGYQPSDQPELLVNIHLQRRSEGELTRTAADYYQYRHGLYAWRDGVSTATQDYSDGTLNIDVIDFAAHRLVWEGIAVGSISQRMYENLEGTIDAVTAKLFERFPRQAQM